MFEDQQATLINVIRQMQKIASEASDQQLAKTYAHNLNNAADHLDAPQHLEWFLERTIVRDSLEKRGLRHRWRDLL